MTMLIRLCMTYAYLFFNLCLISCSATTTQITPLIVGKTVSIGRLELKDQPTSSRSRRSINQGILSIVLTSPIIRVPSSSYRISELTFMNGTDESNSKSVTYDHFYKLVNYRLESSGSVTLYFPDYQLDLSVYPDKKLITIATKPKSRLYEYEDARIRFQYNSFIVDFNKEPRALDPTRPFAESALRPNISIYQKSIQ